MSTTASPPRSRLDSRRESSATDTDPTELLELLSDAYVRDILNQLGESPQSAAELAAQLTASRPTIYRRLNRMAEARIVESSMSIDSDGHHRQEFRAVSVEATVEFTHNGIETAVTS